MKELLLSGIEKNSTAEQKTNTLRENLQIAMLKMLADRGAFRNICFVGGTALRIIYYLQRFSEDLDFSLSKKDGFDFNEMIEGLKTDLDRTGIGYAVKKGDEKTVKYGFFKFPGLLADAGASRLKAENLSVKLEIDTNPPAGWEAETSLVNKFYIFQVNHYKIESLFAGKLHACLFRKYVKARDYYDLMWYLTKKIKPNFTLLNNAVEQTEKQKMEINEANLPGLIKNRLDKLDFKQVRTDVARFLSNPEEAELLTKENFEKLL